MLICGAGHVFPGRWGGAGCVPFLRFGFARKIFRPQLTTCIHWRIPIRIAPPNPSNPPVVTGGSGRAAEGRGGVGRGNLAGW